MAEKICGNCRYFRAGKNECRRYPPTHRPGLGGHWPIVPKPFNDTCGEYKRITPPDD